MSQRRGGIKINSLTFQGQGQINEGERVMTKGTDADGVGQSDEELMIKGRGLDGAGVDMDNITKILRGLYTHKDDLIRTTDNNTKKYFESIVETMSVLANTKAYDTVYAKIQEIFGGLKGATPGTIGAHFAGCLLRTNFSGPPSCSAICSGGVGVQGVSNCDVFTLLLDKERHINSLNAGTPANRGRAYIYVPDTLEFDGFTQNEVTQFSQLGIKEAKVIKYSTTGTQYTDLTQGFVQVAQLPKAGSGTKDIINGNNPNGNINVRLDAKNGLNNGAKGSDGESSSATMWVWIILGILLLIFLIYVGYRAFKK